MVDLIHVCSDIRVVDEWGPGFKALLNELALLFFLSMMPGIKEVILVSVEISVSLNVLETPSIRHHNDVEVAAHSNGRLQGWDWSELAEAINEGNEADGEHYRKHAHQELLLSFAQIVDHVFKAGHQNGTPTVWLEFRKSRLISRIFLRQFLLFFFFRPNIFPALLVTRAPLVRPSRRLVHPSDALILAIALRLLLLRLLTIVLVRASFLSHQNLIIDALLLYSTNSNNKSTLLFYS